MVEKIVVALDGSAPSESALCWAMERAERTNAQVTLITVIEDVFPAFHPGVSERLAVAGRSFLDDAQERARKLAPGVEITGEVGRGSVLSALISIAHDANLLVIGTHKHGVISGAILGTLSLRLVSSLSCSIAVIPEAAPTGQHIVVGADGSDEALFACEVAAAEAVVCGSELLIVCAGYVTNPLFTSLVPHDIASFDHAKVLEQAQAHVLKRFPHAHIRTESVYGAPADALGDASRSARLLVLGHRTRSRLQRLMGDSVHSQVLLDMSVPVLLARRPVGATPVPPATQLSERPRKLQTGERTIVGWSGSSASENALVWASMHETHRGGHLVVARVVDDALFLRRLDSDRVVTAARMELDDRAAQVRRDNPGLVVETLLRTGEPYDELRRMSDPSTLVVVGAHQASRSPLRNPWSLGVRLAANTSGPITIVPQGGYESRDFVVVGIDGSVAAAAAARFAANDAALCGSELQIVHVWQQPMAWHDQHSQTDEESMRSVADAHEHVLDDAAAAIRAAYPELRLHRNLVQGGPAQALLEAAKGARLLVVGNQGAHAMTRPFLGSVSHTVALNIKSPIVFVPASAQEQE